MKIGVKYSKKYFWTLFNFGKETSAVMNASTDVSAHIEIFAWKFTKYLEQLVWETVVISFWTISNLGCIPFLPKITCFLAEGLNVLKLIF